MRWWYRLSHMKHVRAVTTRLPRALQSALSWALAVLLEIVLWTPCRLLERLPRGAALVERIPLGDACRRPMRAKMRSVFDRINPPLTYYHTAEELHEWLAAGGITGGAVRNRDGRGWMISGTRGE
jgi:hypothetical protein